MSSTKQDVNRINEVINRKFARKISKCCGYKVIYDITGGKGRAHVTRRCSKCQQAIKYSEN